MATYFVASGGSDIPPYDTWAKAANTLASGLSAATAAGDVVVIQYNAVPSTDAEGGADVAYTFAGDILLISASNDGGSAFTPTAMETANWIGNSTTNRSVQFSGNDRKVRVHGITLRTSGSTADGLYLASGTGLNVLYEKCYFWHGNTGTSANISLAGASSNYNSFLGCTFRFGDAAQNFDNSGSVSLINCVLSSSGSAPTALFFSGSAGNLVASGCDFSLVTGTVVDNIGQACTYIFERCTFGSAAMVLAVQTANPTLASPSVFLSDCLIGTSRVWGHYNALGSTVRESGIYYTDSAAGYESWKITGTSYASYRVPYESPWVDLYNTGTSGVTPRFEILRDGSATAYTDAEVWAQWSWKNTASSPLASGIANDWQGIAAAAAGTAGTSQAAGAGTGSWTGEGGTAWSGKVDSGSAITPTEAGYLRGRVCVAASITLYVDPVIRTA